MSRKIRLGVVNPETWDFFRELYEYFCSEFETNVFESRGYSIPLLRRHLERHLIRRDLNSFLRRNDVVFFEWASNLLALATRMPKSAKIVTRLHRWELYKWADGIDWDLVDRIILVSAAKREEFLQRFPNLEPKVRVIPESINLSRFPLIPRAFSGTIGTLCHIRPRKRVYDLILTFSELLNRNPSLSLYIGGNSVPDQMDYYCAIRQIVKRLSLERSVHFDGLVERPEDWYRKIDIFVSNSYSEGLQVSPMEAMASGCHTLSHYWDGAEELLPKDYLYLTSGELQDKILTFCELTDEAKDRERGKQRRIVADNFSIELNSRKFGKIIEEVVSS